jgi:excisionase family DNA binding protein
MKNVSTVDSSRLMTVEDAAGFLGITKSTLDKWRSEKRNGLPFVRIGRLVRYRHSDLLAWLVSKTVKDE